MEAGVSLSIVCFNGRSYSKVVVCVLQTNRKVPVLVDFLSSVFLLENISVNFVVLGIVVVLA